MENALNANDVKDDSMYILKQESIRQNLQKYDLKNLTSMDHLVYLKHISDQLGFGVFAKQFIKKGKKKAKIYFIFLHFF